MFDIKHARVVTFKVSFKKGSLKEKEMAYKKAKITIVGKKPLLLNSFSEELLSFEGRKEKRGSKGNDPEEWKQTVMMDEDRKLFLGNDNIFACLKDGSKYVKEGRGSIQKKLVASLQIEEDRVFLEDRALPEEDELTRDATQKVYLDVRVVNNPNTKGRNLRYRIACCKGWRTSFHISWDASLVAVGKMQLAVEDAGNLAGIGDGRSIGFGRFDVESFTLITD